MRVIRSSGRETESESSADQALETASPRELRPASEQRAADQRRGNGESKAAGSNGDSHSSLSDDRVARAEVERLQTEVERLRNELFLAREELIRLHRDARVDASSRLIDALGHELRTSLTLMLGWTELLGAGSLPAERHAQVLDSIYSAGWRIEAALRWLERVSEKRNLSMVDNPLAYRVPAYVEQVD